MPVVIQLMGDKKNKKMNSKYDIMSVTTKTLGRRKSFLQKNEDA